MFPCASVAVRTLYAVGATKVDHERVGWKTWAATETPRIKNKKAARMMVPRTRRDFDHYPMRIHCKPVSDMNFGAVCRNSLSDIGLPTVCRLGFARISD